MAASFGAETEKSTTIEPDTTRLIDTLLWVTTFRPMTVLMTLETAALKKPPAMSSWALYHVKLESLRRIVERTMLGVERIWACAAAALREKDS